MSRELSPMSEVLPAEDLLDQVLTGQAGRSCITCSFQAEDVVILHMVRQRLPGIPVLFLDTGYHFEETYAYWDHLAAAWKLNFRNIRPVMNVAEQENADPSRY